jgi:hypothetical protein
MHEYQVPKLLTLLPNAWINLIVNSKKLIWSQRRSNDAYESILDMVC